jgi:hypothetical protein
MRAGETRDGGLVAWALGSAPGQLCPGRGPRRNGFGQLRDHALRTGAAVYVKSQAGKGAYCRLGRGFAGFSEGGGLDSTGGRSATLFARLRRL